MFIEKSVYLLQKRNIIVRDLKLKNHVLDYSFQRKVFILTFTTKPPPYTSKNWKEVSEVFLFAAKSKENISYDDIKKKITKRTKAIYVIHYAGNSCEIEKISLLAKKNKIKDAHQKSIHKKSVGGVAGR